MADDPVSSFEVPLFQHILGGFVERYRTFWVRLGQLETSRLANALSQVKIRSPIYISGLARSGSTLLHEIVASHPFVATHRMKDYPMLFTPFWWRRATAHLQPSAARERAHRDGVMVNTESPDAIEEMLWMTFFPHCHNPAVSHVLTAAERQPAFESFYDAHLRKLLLVEGATRYSAKNNYHVSRLLYLHRLYPDAKFLIPVRAPVGHIASLMRQHQLFSKGHRRFPRSQVFMRRSGHFEFGRLRHPIHLGNAERVREIRSLWVAGDEVRGLAKYWDMVYGYLARLLESNERLKSAVLIVRHETICEFPAESLRSLLSHCQLPLDEGLIERWAQRIRGPRRSEVGLSGEDLKVIDTETHQTSQLWGYQHQE